MDKVKLPREVAEAIEDVRKHYKAGAEYDLELMRQETFGGTKVIAAYTKESRHNLVRYLQAITIGYEVEQTPGEMVRGYYKTLLEIEEKQANPEDEQFIKGEQAGVKMVLNLLGIKIEGVNT